MRFFNNTSDKANYLSLKATQFVSAGKTVLFPTHSHQLAAQIFTEASLLPKLSPKSKLNLLNYAQDVITPEFQTLCHKDKDPNQDLSLVLHDKYGHDLEAMRAIIKVVNTNPQWKLWRQPMIKNCHDLYPEITEAEWIG